MRIRTVVNASIMVYTICRANQVKIRVCAGDEDGGKQMVTEPSKR